MVRITSVLFVILGHLVLASGVALACKFTPLEWQQPVGPELETSPRLVGQRKHTTWIRDANRNFIDDEIERRFFPATADATVDVVVDINTCLTPPQIQELLGNFGQIRSIGKLISFVLLDGVPVTRLSTLAALPEVAMVELQVVFQIMNDVSTRAVESRASVTFSPNTAQDAGFTGTGITIAILDTGVDDGHETFTGKFIAGFNALNFNDSNGNGVDDSCESSPVGNGVCTDPDDEPGDGTTNPDDDHFHGTHVAGTAIGAGMAGRVCSPPDDGSVTNCAGVASGAGLVDIKICNMFGSCDFEDIAEALDWLGINTQKLAIRVANMSIGGCVADDGTSAMPQQVNYVVALGVTVAVAHGNAGGSCPPPGTVLTSFPGSASFAITVGGTNDQNTVGRGDDTNFSGFLRGPRFDFNPATPNLLALKPDLAAPGQNIVSALFNTISNYTGSSGTSMAAPHVAGAAAVLLQAQSTLDPGSLKDLLKRSADRTNGSPTPPRFVAQFPLVDPLWDNDLGSGLLDVWAALNAAAATDVGFPSCIVAPGIPGQQPCALTPPMPPWNNTADIATATPPQINVANTIIAQVRNDGAVTATLRVNFGVYIFAVGNNQFFHIGTQQVTIPPMTTVAVSQAWTPAASNHQCIQVSIDFGLDTNFGNNVTQRNFQVAPAVVGGGSEEIAAANVGNDVMQDNLPVASAVFQVQIENPFFVPARLEIQTTVDRRGWNCESSEESFTLDPFQDCPRQVSVTVNPPPGAQPGEQANCDVTVFATPAGEQPRLIGGVTVQTFVPQPGPAFTTLCSRLGDDPRPSLLDQDIFTFAGTAGEQVTIRVEQDPAGVHTGERVTLIVIDAIIGAVLVRIDNSALPNEITATLPATGTYLIIIAEQPNLAPGERFRGEYCLTLESSGGAAQTLEPTVWVE